MFGDVYHIGYLTDDIEAAKRFYRDTFGAEVKAEVPGGPNQARMAFLRVGRTEVELIEPPDPARLNGRTGLVIDHVGYVVDDVDASMKELEAKGVRFEGAPRVNAEGARLVYMQSDSVLGTRIHLTERPGQRG